MKKLVEGEVSVGGGFSLLGFEARTAPNCFRLWFRRIRPLPVFQNTRNNGFVLIAANLSAQPQRVVR